MQQKENTQRNDWNTNMNYIRKDSLVSSAQVSRKLWKTEGERWSKLMSTLGPLQWSRHRCTHVTGLKSLLEGPLGNAIHSPLWCKILATLGFLPLCSLRGLDHETEDPANFCLEDVLTVCSRWASAQRQATDSLPSPWTLTVRQPHYLFIY